MELAHNEPSKYINLAAFAYGRRRNGDSGAALH